MRKIRIILNWLGWIVAFVFLGIAAWRLTQLTDWQTIFTSVSINNVVIALVFLWIGLFIYSLSGYVSLSIVGLSISISESWRIWFISQLSKYIPGGIWQFATRGVMYARVGTSISMGGILTLWETTAIVLTGMLIFIVLGIFQNIANVLLWFVGAGLLLLIVVITLDQRIIDFLKRKNIPFSIGLLNDLGVDGKKRYQGFLRLSSLATIGWVFINLGFHFTVLALVPESEVSILDSFFAFALAWVVGFLVIISPGGLGAREATLIAFYTPLLGESLAISIALISRLLWFVAEITHIVSATMIFNFFKMRQNKQVD